MGWGVCWGPRKQRLFSVSRWHISGSHRRLWKLMKHKILVWEWVRATIQKLLPFFFFNNWNLRAPANLDPFVLSWTKLFLVASSVLKPKIRTDSNSLQQSGFLPCSPSHSCPRNPLISRWSSARRRKIGQRGEYVAQARVRALNLPARALVSPIRTSPLHRWSSLLSSVDTSGVSNKRRSSTCLHSCSIEATASWLFMTITHPPGWIESPWVYGDQLPRRGIDSQ
jgi:hypothetical protein